MKLFTNYISYPYGNYSYTFWEVNWLLTPSARPPLSDRLLARIYNLVDTL